MKCPKCNENIPDNYKFCGNCGYKVESRSKTCPKVNCQRTDLPPEALFCPDCGTKLKDVNKDGVRIPGEEKLLKIVAEISERNELDKDELLFVRLISQVVIKNVVSGVDCGHRSENVGFRPV